MTRTDLALLLGAASVVVIAALVGNALAAPASCIDTKRSYIARPLTANQVWVQNSIGQKKPPVRLTTSCHHLGSANAISVSGQFSCISLGDPVVATSGAERQNCVVTKVEAYAAADGDLPQK
jgi:hypothetical protein